MEFIALTNQPFSVVGDVGFRRLVEHRYTLPSASSDVAQTELHSNSVTAISFTTDIWTSDISPMSMLSLDSTVGRRGFRIEESRFACS